VKTAKRVFYQQEIGDCAAANAKDNCSGYRKIDNKEKMSEKKSGKKRRMEGCASQNSEAQKP
jgi:hypothetical protein